MPVFSAASNKKAVDRASNVSRRTADKVLRQNQKFFDIQRESTASARALGEQAIGLVSDELGKPIEASESFKFSEKELQKTLDRRLAAIGAFNSGNNIRESINLKQRLIGSEIGRRDRLIGSALGIGQTGRSQFGTEVSQQSARQSGAISDLGSTLASAEIAKGRISAGVAGGLFKLGVQGAGALFGGPAGADGAAGGAPGAAGGVSGGFDLGTSFG